ncbi:hypothetical protein [Yinghuangia sp. YIM S09857]|uniref:hypothetical protein n=1 Tax=Yinghuangia sp. YIM S09857 TaxID=3436929 RepID=UPI003F534692
MTNSTPPRTSRMTIRVYRITPETGEQTTLRPRREIALTLPIAPPLPSNPLAFPACRCLGCRVPEPGV